MNDYTRFVLIWCLCLIVLGGLLLSGCVTGYPAIDAPSYGEVMRGGNK